MAVARGFFYATWAGWGLFYCITTKRPNNNCQGALMVMFNYDKYYVIIRKANKKTISRKFGRQREVVLEHISLIQLYHDVLLYQQLLVYYNHNYNYKKWYRKYKR